MKTYSLQCWKLHALPQRGLMRCHLHGVGHGWWGQLITHEEFVNIPLLAHEPIQKTIRRAVAASSHVWKVNLLKNLSVFDGKFYQPVREQTRETEDTIQEFDERITTMARSNA